MENIVQAILDQLGEHNERARTRILSAAQIEAGLRAHLRACELSKGGPGICTRIRFAVCNGYDYKAESDVVELWTTPSAYLRICAGRGPARRTAFGKGPLAVQASATIVKSTVPVCLEIR